MGVLDSVIEQTNDERSIAAAICTYLTGVKAALTAAGTDSTALAALNTAIDVNEAVASIVKRRV